VAGGGEETWRALGDARRRRILDALRAGPLRTGELCARFPGLARVSVLKHLAVLHRARLVVVRAVGRERWNQLNALPLRDACGRWLLPYADRWAEVPVRSKARAEGREREGSPMARKSAAAKAVTIRRFSITLEVDIAAPPARVFRALVGEIGRWWKTHFFDPKLATGMRLEPWPGGRMYEAWRGKDEGAFWGVVSEIEAPRRLELRGTMGLPGGVQGLVGIDLAAKKGGTRLALRHDAIGDIEADAGEMYAGGWSDLLDYLRAHVQGGSRGARKKR
jgi:uncharacterized protein YndB with AHSA1/START domain/DNA-binding transcriptional ArsR family regulator